MRAGSWGLLGRGEKIFAARVEKWIGKEQDYKWHLQLGGAECDCLGEMVVSGKYLRRESTLNWRDCV